MGDTGRIVVVLHDTSAAAAAVGIQRADEIVGRRLGDGTKGCYVSGINQVKKFLRSTDRLAVHLDADNVIVPLPIDVVKKTFGTCHFKTNGKSKGDGAIDNYRCALKDMYKKRGVPKESIDSIDSFIVAFLARV